MTDPLGPKQREELAAAYAAWVETHDESVEWAWEKLHDGVWWHTEPLAMLETIIGVANRLTNNHAALLELGAGPLEDLLGGDPETMAEAVKEARSNAAFRVAVSNVNGVKHREPGYEDLRQVVQGASSESG